MASLASGGSILGVMGLAYSQGIPTTLALFAGAVIGFPLASILVARHADRFGRFTITDFLVFRFPSPVVRALVPALIVAAFTACSGENSYSALPSSPETTRQPGEPAPPVTYCTTG